MEIIVICNRKGGCGKTTTATALFSYLDTVAKKNVLLIDADGQCNSTYAMGMDVDKPNLHDILTGRVDIQDAMQGYFRLFCSYVIAGSDLLSNIDNNVDHISINWADELKKVEDMVDYIVIDTGLAYGRVTTLMLSCATKIVVPVMADVHSLQGLDGIADLVNEANPKTGVTGVLLLRYRGWLLIARRLKELAQEKTDEMGIRLLGTVIRDGVVVAESATMQQGLYQYDHKLKSNVAQDYARFAEELLEGK